MDTFKVVLLLCDTIGRCAIFLLAAVGFLAALQYINFQIGWQTKIILYTAVVWVLIPEIYVWRELYREYKLIKGVS